MYSPHVKAKRPNCQNSHKQASSSSQKNERCARSGVLVTPGGLVYGHRGRGYLHTILRR